MTFPINPSNGELIEESPGAYYQYSAVTKSWYRVSTPSIPMATPVSDGLMAKEDFLKLTGLIIPPPKISISTECCTDKSGNILTFNQGLLQLEGDSDNIISVEVSGQNLHENTAVVNFKVDTQKLAQKLESLGKIRVITTQGEPGEQGDAGADGANSLPVGPQGEDGQAGKNAPWPGVLVEESFDVAQQGRAVVDISTQTGDENYLVVTRASIGSPTACPNTIIPTDVQSPWLLAFSPGVNPTSTSTSSVPSKCLRPVVNSSGQTCGWACTSNLYYLDIDAIVQAIHAHWIEYLNGVKAEKEELADAWLAAMMTQFNTQKAALCCALEACQSRSRNQDARRYIEQSRIAAAAANFNLVIGSDQDKEFPPVNSAGECYWNIAPSNMNLLHLSDPDCKVDWASICGGLQ